MKTMKLSMIIMMMISFGNVMSYIPSSDSSFFKAFGLVDRLKTISNALTEEEDPTPKSPLDAFPAVNPHNEPQKSESALINFFKKRPNFKIKPRIFDPEAITSFLTLFHPLTNLGGGSSDQPYAPAASPQPVIPHNLPEVVPVPLPFKVAPVKIVFPTIPKGDNKVVPVVPKGQYSSRRYLQRRLRQY